MNSIELVKEIKSLKQQLTACESLIENLNRIEKVSSIELQLKGPDFTVFDSLCRPETDAIDINLVKEIIKNNLECELVAYLYKLNNLSISLD
jgi:hypothetical protein